MTTLEIYLASDGEATKGLYRRLDACGPIGHIATNLFRAQKCSERAKLYRGGQRGKGSYRQMAYDRKQWSIDNLCAALTTERLGIVWGWSEDASTVFDGIPSHVLYVDLPTGQVSFHSPLRGTGPVYHAKWDGVRGASPGRIIQFCDAILNKEANGQKNQDSRSCVQADQDHAR